MDLTLWERLILAQIFPAEVAPLLVGIAGKLRADLPPTEDEIAEWGIGQDERGIHWSPEVDTTREVHVGAKGKELLAGALKAAPRLPVGSQTEALLGKFGVELDAED